jgi:hypothetical protein
MGERGRKTEKEETLRVDQEGPIMDDSIELRGSWQISTIKELLFPSKNNALGNMPQPVAPSKLLAMGKGSDKAQKPAPSPNEACLL